MEDLEVIRKANIQRNTKHLGDLGILLKSTQTRPSSTVTGNPPPAKKRRIESTRPSRSSARIASAPAKPSYNEDDAPERASSRNTANKKRPPKQTSEAEDIMHHRNSAPPKDVSILRAGWKSWHPSASPPIRSTIDSTFHFSSHSTFRPNKSPEEMLREGCFGGSYFRPLYSNILKITIEDDYLELPPSWISGLNTSRYLTSPNYDPEVNKYKVKCGQSIEEWEANGWIAHEFDVRGWFQWYCQFFAGRRCADDERQVGRWERCVGLRGRWRRMLLKKYVGMGVREVFDDGEDEDGDGVSPVMHQTCFQWGYEVRQPDLDRFWEKGT